MPTGDDRGRETHCMDRNGEHNPGSPRCKSYNVVRWTDLVRVSSRHYGRLEYGVRSQQLSISRTIGSLGRGLSAKVE